jgi:hypothetical protein
MRHRLTFYFLGFFLGGSALATACGGTEATLSCGGDAGSDATSDAVALTPEGGAAAEAATGDAGAGPADAAPPDDASSVEAGPACGPPGNPAQAALCLHIQPEAIAFTSDPKFDGKGFLVAQVFDTANPDLADGGTVPALASALLPSGAPSAGSLDLSQGVPTIRFDGLPTHVFVRAIFVDDPAPHPNFGASSWIAGYDLSAGIRDNLPLLPRDIPAGTGTDLSLYLFAFREMTITVNRTATPAGNGQGPATAVAIANQVPATGSAVFGIGRNACARVDGANTAELAGAVIGQGPYYVTAALDDFGAAHDAGIGLPPGSLVSLEPADGGGYAIPSANLLSYPANAYRVSHTITLNMTVPGAPATDPVTCP